ncbi:hypothetical protein ACPPVV_00245 [Rhodanobacter sp. Col0626]|uniref:hypothetical protein n=1 Tax=Rhodanobacter sp. Col0626 TaxID=3415679 RepID=UPI003CF97BFD
MSVLKQVAKVQEAQLRVSVVRHELSTPAAALLSRGRKYPLTTVGTAAGAGFVLGSLNVHPMRIPGLGSLLGGGLAEAVAYATRLVVDLGVSGFEHRASDARADEPTDQRDDSEPT